LKIRIRSSLLSVLIFFPLLGLILAGCNASSNQPMAAIDNLPENIKTAPAVTMQSYQFAAAHPELMNQIPCYCGCVDLGHTSNYACYVSSVDANGKITYDDHALGCSICVDITQDVVRLSKLGKPVTEIRAYIDQTYSQYGPANIP
jgi:hypothetical protein